MKVIANRRVMDPSMSDAEYIYQRSRKPGDPTVGTVWVSENAATRIGGLALIRRALDHHKRAAEWFKNAYEALYGGGMAPAIDLSAVRVDTTIMAHDGGVVGRLDRAKSLQDAMDTLGKATSDRIIASVVLCIPCSEIAPPGPSGKPSGRAVEREVDYLLDALDQLAEIRGFKMRGRAA